VSKRMHAVVLVVDVEVALAPRSQPSSSAGLESVWKSRCTAHSGRHRSLQ
jgi:hypothetical protein